MLGSEWLGPVYEFDRGMVARSRWTYLSRVLFVALVLAGLALTHASIGDVSDRGLIRQLAETGSSFFALIVLAGITGALLIGPPAVVGTICHERSRGHYELCLAGGVDSIRIVAGKLLARLWPVLTTLAAILPVIALSTLLGGVDPARLMHAFAICCALAVLSSAVGASLAFRTNKPHEALSLTYVLMLAWLILLPFVLLCITDLTKWNIGRIGWGVIWYNPIWVCFADDGMSGSPVKIEEVDPTRGWGVVILMLGVSAVCVAVTAVRLRTCLSREEVAPRKTKRRELTERDEQELDLDPVRWRESRRRDARGMKWAWRGYEAMAVIGAVPCLIACVQTVDLGPVPLILWFQIAAGLILIAAVSPTAMAEERTRGRLDVLFVTTLSTPEIVLGKWNAGWAILRRWLVIPILTLFIAVLLPRDDSPTFAFPTTPPPPPVLEVEPIRSEHLVSVVGAGALGFGLAPIGLDTPPSVGIAVPVPPPPVGIAASGLIPVGENPFGSLPLLVGAAAPFANRLISDIETNGFIVPVPGGYIVVSSTVPMGIGYGREDSAWIRLASIPVLVLYMLAVGRAVSGFGMLLAVLLRRPGQASAWCVGLLVLGALVTAAPLMILDESTFFAHAWSGVSPISFPFALAENLLDQVTSARRFDFLLGVVGTVSVSVVLTYGFRELTIRVLDAKFGRVDARGAAIRTPATI